ncbi:MAG TPA: diacylglycerol kinase family protein [Mycobacteriales bacterium]|nr:diacylglycerol kinase family protein [Mycobacteriales bacterium]
MPHPLGEVALLVATGRDAPDRAALDEMCAALTARDVAFRRAAVGGDQRAVAAELHRVAAAGTRLVVMCGGQRVFRAAVEALRAGGAATEQVVLGVFPGGRSHDFAKSFGLDANPRAAALLLSSDRVMRVDLGRAVVATAGGAARTHLVVNDAVVGLGAAVCRKNTILERVPRIGPLTAWWATLVSYRPRRFDVDMTFAEWHDDAVQVRIANGQFAHDGLHVSPLALPDDGAWDVQVWDGPVHLPFTLQPRMLLGEHLPHEHISQWRQKRVEVATAKPTPVAVDGRYVGTTPAVFELDPGALRLKI